jgi:hypothetical protein
VRFVRRRLDVDGPPRGYQQLTFFATTLPAALLCVLKPSV